MVVVIAELRPNLTLAFSNYMQLFIPTRESVRSTDQTILDANNTAAISSANTACFTKQGKGRPIRSETNKIIFLKVTTPVPESVLPYQIVVGFIYVPLKEKKTEGNGGFTFIHFWIYLYSVTFSSNFGWKWLIFPV